MSDETESLHDAISHRNVEEAADLLEQETGAEAARVLCELNPLVAPRVLAEMADDSRAAVLASASPDQAKQWLDNREHPEESDGWLTEPLPATFRPEATVADTVEACATSPGPPLSPTATSSMRAADSSASSSCATFSSPCHRPGSRR